MPRAGPHQYNPTHGVRDDFLAVMNEFLELKTVRFSEFSTVWRSKKMSFLSAGRFSDGEAREFIERSFVIALEFFLPPFQFQVRVCGLYLLYALFETQPVTPKVKVRLTQAQWKDALHFRQEAAQQNHLDVVYVFNQMIQRSAFFFCFTGSEISSRSNLNDAENTTLNLAEDMKDDHRVIDTLFNYEAMEKLSYLLDHYQQMKVTMAGPEATQPDKSLDVVQGTMVEDLVSMLQNFKTVTGNILKHGKASGETNEEQQGQSSGDKTGSVRQALKAKAFSQVKTCSMRGRYTVVSDKSSSGEENPQEQQNEIQYVKPNMENDPVSYSGSGMEESTKETSSLQLPKFDGDDIIRVEVYSKSNNNNHNSEVKWTEEANHKPDIKYIITQGFNGLLEGRKSAPANSKSGRTSLEGQSSNSGSLNVNVKSNASEKFRQAESEGLHDNQSDVDLLLALGKSEEITISQEINSDIKELDFPVMHSSRKGKGKKSRSHDIQYKTEDLSPHSKSQKITQTKKTNRKKQPDKLDLNFKGKAKKTKSSKAVSETEDLTSGYKANKKTKTKKTSGKKQPGNLDTDTDKGKGKKSKSTKALSSTEDLTPGSKTKNKTKTKKTRRKKQPDMHDSDKSPDLGKGQKVIISQGTISDGKNSNLHEMQKGTKGKGKKSSKDLSNNEDLSPGPKIKNKSKTKTKKTSEQKHPNEPHIEKKDTGTLKRKLEDSNTSSNGEPKMKYKFI